MSIVGSFDNVVMDGGAAPDARSVTDNGDEGAADEGAADEGAADGGVTDKGAADQQLDSDMPYVDSRIFFLLMSHRFETRQGMLEEEDDADDLFIIASHIVCFTLAAELSGFVKKKRRRFTRPECMVSSYVYSEAWRDCNVFRLRMRMSYPTFVDIVAGLSQAIPHSYCGITGKLLQSREIKVAVGLWHLAHGGTFGQTADAAGIGESTARLYTQQFCRAVINVMKPTWMPGKPDADRLARTRMKFAERRGMHGIAMTVDGTHVPWVPDKASVREDYHNYKGWYSLSCLMFVDSFYLFIDGDIGHPGRAGDSEIGKYSWLMDQVRQDQEAWLGPGGFMIGDGGFGCAGFLMAPFQNASTNRDVYFNYCFSSSRFYVEQCFGWWKNRFRILIKPSNVPHKRMCEMIYASMILHNCLMVTDNTKWEDLLHRLNGRPDHGPAARGLRDPALTDWLTHHEAVFCDECREAVPQVLYCVHSDRIAAQDAELAARHGAQPSRGTGGRYRYGDRASTDPMILQREILADDLWREFLVRHPDFDGVLTEMHLRKEQA